MQTPKSQGHENTIAMGDARHKSRGDADARNIQAIARCKYRPSGRAKFVNDIALGPDGKLSTVTCSIQNSSGLGPCDLEAFFQMPLQYLSHSHASVPTTVAEQAYSVRSWKLAAGGTECRERTTGHWRLGKVFSDVMKDSYQLIKLI